MSMDEKEGSDKNEATRPSYAEGAGGGQGGVRQQRQKARKALRDIAHPYARKQKDGSQVVSAGKGDSRHLLLSERKRVIALPKGKYSIHRLKVIARALELLDQLDGEGSSQSSNGKCELDDLLKQLSLR
jgi:hypothetical protein